MVTARRHAACQRAWVSSVTPEDSNWMNDVLYQCGWPWKMIARKAHADTYPTGFADCLLFKLCVVLCSVRPKRQVSTLWTIQGCLLGVQRYAYSNQNILVRD